MLAVAGMVIIFAIRVVCWENIGEVPVAGILFRTEAWTMRAASVAILAGSAAMWFTSNVCAARLPHLAVSPVLVSALVAGALLALWNAYPAAVQGTRLVGSSPLWPAFAIGLGTALGLMASVLLAGLLVIRDAATARRLGLPRVPIATRAVLSMSLLLGLPLLTIACWAAARAPRVMQSPYWTVLGGVSLTIVLAGMHQWWWYRDDSGRRVPFRERRAQMRRAADEHDAAHQRLDWIEKEHALPRLRSLPPLAMQFAVRRATATIGPHEAVRPRYRVLDSITLEPHPKDGDPYNHDPPNRGLRVAIAEDAPEQQAVRVRATGYIPSTGPQTLSLRVELAAFVAAGEAILQSLGSSWLEYPSWRWQSDPTPFVVQIIDGAVQRALVERVTAEQPSALIRALFDGDEASLTWYLERGGNANVVGFHGWTPLHAAVATGLPDATRKLLEAGADPDVGNVAGHTPLRFAIRYGRRELVTQLLSFGADPNLTLSDGETPLITAILWNQAAMVHELLTSGADPSRGYDDAGRAPIRCAEHHGRGEIAQALRLALLGRGDERTARD
jgi:hypothetical protein